MHSIKFLENMVKTQLPQHLHSLYKIQLYAWNRTKEDKSDPENVPSFTQVDEFGYPVRITGAPATSLSNQYVNSFTVDCINWDFLCYQTWKASKKHELGIGSELIPASHNRWYQQCYIPMIDFNPGLETVTRHTRDFWNFMSSAYKGNTFYLFNSGRAHHGILNKLFDADGISTWLTQLQDFECVDQKWVKYASDYPHSGILRVTPGYNRPQPRLWKWVNL
jgi:hypothetical protein